MSNKANEFDEDDPKTYFSDSDFLGYVAAVGEVIEKRQPVTIGAIHRELGDKAIPRWTMDSLSKLALEELGAGPVRYRFATVTVKDLTKDARAFQIKI
jgi:hypothetical protein